jgi:hypothetical protein
MARIASFLRKEGTKACAIRPAVRAAAASGEGLDQIRARPSE